MSTPSKNAVTPRYRLVDTVTGQQHDVTYGSGMLCNVTNTPRGIAEDAMPGDLRGTADGERYRLLETLTGVVHPIYRATVAARP